VVLDQHAHVLGRADQHELGALELLELDREAALVPHLIVLVEDHQQRPAPEGPLDGGAEVAEDGLDLAQRRLAPVHQQQILELPSQGGVLPAGQLRLHGLAVDHAAHGERGRAVLDHRQQGPGQILVGARAATVEDHGLAEAPPGHQVSQLQLVHQFVLLARCDLPQLDSQRGLAHPRLAEDREGGPP